jgi:hypothetical protein
MPMPRTLLAAALAAASLAAPAAHAAGQADPLQDYVTTVSTDANYTLAHRLDATCVFVADRWSMDERPTRVAGVATTTGASWTSVTCEIYNYGYLGGDVTFAAAAPAVADDASVRVNAAAAPYLQVCVTAEASWSDAHVVAPRRCFRP